MPKAPGALHAAVQKASQNRRRIERALMRYEVKQHDFKMFEGDS
jgi:hypothetical protein